MLKQQRGHGFSAVLRLEFGGASFVPCYLIFFYKAVSGVVYNIELIVPDIVARVDAPDVPGDMLAVGRQNRQTAIRAAGDILVVHRAPEILVFGVYTDLILFREKRQFGLSLGIVIAENYGERDIFLRNRRDYLFDSIIHIFICELLPVAADVVAAENDKIGISNFDASTNDIYRLFALIYRYLSVLLIVHLRGDLMDISQMQNAEFSVRAEAQGSLLFFYIFL